jgi:hypothetical protein
MASIIGFMLFLFITIGVSALISQLARIPSVHRRAQNSIVFRWSLSLSLSVLAVVVVILVTSTLLVWVEFGDAVMCRLDGTESAETDVEFPCNKLAAELFVRVVIPYDGDYCFSRDKDVCAIADYAPYLTHIIGHWFVALIIGMFTGAFTYRFTRDNRKPKREMN